jgi:ABC-type phosphate/phosphonate transport system substrate-binding protein
MTPLKLPGAIFYVLKRLGNFLKTAFYIAPFLVYFFLGTTVSSSASSTDFYYYNPDSLQSNLSHLKAEMDILLVKTGRTINFQAFAHYTDFDKKTIENKPAFLIIPDWYIQKRGTKLKVRPLLQPLLDKSSQYKKILMVTKTSDISFSKIRGLDLAMTTMGPDSENILNKILFSRQGADARRLSIVTVPKDSDALFALALGQVDMALATQPNIQKLKIINPNIFKKLKSLDESLPIPLPILCYMEGRADKQDIDKIRQVFLNLGKQQSDLKAMEMLQIDEWKKIGH